MHPSASLQVLDRFLDVVSVVDPDILHMHSAVQPSAWFVDRLLRMPNQKRPFVLTQHGSLETTDRMGVVRSLLLKADVVTAVSNAVLQSALEFSRPACASLVIPNGVGHLAATASRDIAAPPFALTCVGRLQMEKGFDLAIVALAAVRRSGFDAELTLIGQGENRKFFVETAAAHGVAEHVRFAGVLDRVETRRAIANSTLVLVPSRTREGFSLVAAEAASCGVPCVAARTGGLPETVEDGVTGVLVPPEDAEALAAAIVGLLGDRAGLRDLGANARRMARGKFDMDRCVESYNVYRNLMD